MSWGRLRVVLVATEGRRAGQIGVGRGRRRLKMEKLVSIAKSITAKVSGSSLEEGPVPRVSVPLLRCEHPDRRHRLGLSTADTVSGQSGQSLPSALDATITETSMY